MNIEDFGLSQRFSVNVDPAVGWLNQWPLLIFVIIVWVQRTVVTMAPFSKHWQGQLVIHFVLIETIRISETSTIQPTYIGW